MAPPSITLFCGGEVPRPASPFHDVYVLTGACDSSWPLRPAQPDPAQQRANFRQHLQRIGALPQSYSSRPPRRL